jgi:hypothetical protein
MRLRFAALLAATLLSIMTGAPSSFAQYDDSGRYPFLERPSAGYGARQRPSTQYEHYEPRQPTYQPRGSYYEQRAARPYYDQRPARSYYQPTVPFFQPTVPSYGYAVPREVRRPPEVRRRVVRPAEPPPKKIRRYAPAAPSPKIDKPEVAEVEPSTYLVVFGDSLADLLAQGLDTVLEEAEDIAIERKIRGDSGLARNDVHDWPKVIQDTLNGGQKITYALVMLGANDRQAIREGETSHDPLSERWKEIYRQRVDDVLKVFGDRKIPVLWIGAPPMKNERYSTDLQALNEIYKERVQRAGGVYVDIWQGFVDDQNRYSPVGPDVDGQVVRLRTADGVHLTKAGARKLAHFADVELKRLIEARGGTAVAAPTPPGDKKEGDVDRLINAALPALPEPAGVSSLPARPVAGPVLPLTKPDVSPGGALASGRSRPSSEGDAYLLDRALQQGIAPPARPGRADDFKWPRS